MPVVSDGDIAKAAMSAGWQGNDAVVAVAVALAESSGRADVHNSIGASGLWQVLQSAHPEFSQQWRDGTWKDPTVNARMGYQVWRAAGNSWRPWQAYTNGTYRIFMNRAKAAVANPANAASAGVNAGEAAAGTIGTGGGIGGGIVDGVKFLTDPQNWLRLGEFLLGLTLVIVALARISGADKLAIKGAKAYATGGASLV